MSASLVGGVRLYAIALYIDVPFPQREKRAQKTKVKQIARNEFI